MYLRLYVSNSCRGLNLEFYINISDKHNPLFVCVGKYCIMGPSAWKASVVSVNKHKVGPVLHKLKNQIRSVLGPILSGGANPGRQLTEQVVGRACAADRMYHRCKC